MRAACFLIAACAACSASAGPAVYRWIVETSRPTAQTIDVFQGETVTLEPTLLSYGEPADLDGSAVTLWYQTNGMGSAWWPVVGSTGTVAGRISATFAPSNDVGAAQYSFYMQAASEAGANYRA
jgi:hypothetical protein